MDSMKLVPYIENSGLSKFAASCAKSLAPLEKGSGRADAVELKKSLRQLEKCHSVLLRRYEDAADVPAACEWLLDNRYMIQREFPDTYASLLAAREQRSCRGTLLVVALCKALLQSGQGSLSAQRCEIFLEGFQRVTVLQQNELRLFPAALRCVIIEALSHCAQRLERSTECESAADEFAALFSSLRLLSTLDMESILDRANVPGAILARDPSAHYSRMDRASRLEYLERLRLLASKQGLEEQELAEKLIARAVEEKQHIGFYLFTPPSPRRAEMYIVWLCLTTFFLNFFIAIAADSIFIAALLLLPLWSMLKGFTDFVLLHWVKPRPMPRLDMSGGIPQEGKSICVISALLGCCDAGRLEELRLASRREGKNLLFGLLADLPAAAQEHCEDDERLIAEARRSVEMLNRKYGGGFYLFWRSRSFDGEGWSGRERKRGALIELARLLQGEGSALNVCGDEKALEGTRYIISLDADTRIYPGSIARLIGAALHPMCSPVIDEKRGVVSAGHGIIHPRIETELESASATDFALIFSGGGGSDPYGGLCAELYMDSFDNGGFAGKGLIHAEALLKCTAERFPEGQILSHDALEGAYLSGAYMSDAEFSDAFPANALSYYKRQHRWVRGDWQNSPWMHRQELSAMDRFRLFDSLRRSLNAPMTLIAMLFGFFLSGPGLRLAAWAALLSLLQTLFLSLAESGFSRREGTRLRRHTRLLSGVGGAIVRCFMQLWLLPYEAWVNLSAALTALWRMLVSRRKLLQWQTFAQTGGGADFAGHIKSMWPAVMLGLILMAFSPAIIGKASGFMWLLSPAAAWALALPAYKEQELSLHDRELLYTAVNEHWLYLKELSRREDNFLPPDNFQQQPPVGIAHRTSPTNIGLALAAAASAAKSGIIRQSEALGYISAMLPTLESMAKYRGHFFNWYDTRTLRPLKPEHISTVDSGNMYAGLICCAAALDSWGRYELAGRIRRLADDMDFSLLFDDVRELFYISYDSEKQRGVGGWYDLMASEAMLTSYLALAKGDVPLRHWRRLSRAQLMKDGYRGLASWTGTMFEYLMPALFLPVYRASLLYESDRFCLYVQKRRRYPGKPWGISESAFYSLDAQLNYRYKAHGCPALALKRGQEADMVIAPYASFLALAADPKGSAANLRRLKELGACGRWGFIEALDFTPGRCSREDGEQIRCWMAHHVSMSILAAVNALDKGAVRELFLSSPDMAAHTLLLQEKLPEGTALIRREPGRIPERPRQRLRRPWQIRGEGRPEKAAAALLSNGAYSLRIKNDGESEAWLGDKCIYSHPAPISFCIDGMALKDTAPELWELGDERCRLSYSIDGMELSITRSAAEGELGEFADIEIKSAKPRRTELSLSFRPILAKMRDYESHSAYWKLGLTAEAEEGELILRRLRKNDEPELWLCLACSEPAFYNADIAGGLGALSEPMIKADVPLRARPGATLKLRFALCLGGNEKDAREGARRILNASAAGGSMPAAAAARLGLSPEDTGKAMEMLLPLWENRLCNARPQRELWPYGISGDLPIICCDGRAKEAEWLIKAFCLLKSCGMETELVLLSEEQGEYMQPLKRRIESILSTVGLEALMGCPGGIFTAPLEAKAVLSSRAAVFIGEEKSLPAPMPTGFEPGTRELKQAPVHKWQGDCFEYSTGEKLPPRIWQHILTNGALGGFAADFGPAGLWLENAREMKLIAPPEDIRAAMGHEQIYLVHEGQPISLFEAGDSIPCTVSYAPGLARWEKRIAGRSIETCMFIHPQTNARTIMVKGAEGMELVWQARPHMGGRDAACLRAALDSGYPFFTNEESYLPRTKLRFLCSEPFEAETEFCPAALRMKAKAAQRTLLVCGSFGRESIAPLLDKSGAEQAMQAAREHWLDICGRVKLRCGDRAMEHYMNTWAVYQSLACRIMGRSSIYQSGGAIGFRDQLQDSVNLLLIDPGLARRQILDCCRHQYEEGDVMHWWHAHPEGDRGIRSRCSDDLLWLVWALCEYCEATGDTALCSETSSYVNSPVLSAEEKDRYELPQPSSRSDSVLKHAEAALDRCIARGFGDRGLPLMGSGDWNDGLDRVQGESVWLGFFLSCCAQSFAQLLRELGEEGAEKYEELSRRVGRAAEACFNGRYYQRAYFPDGSTPGEGRRIDSIAQSWAAFAPHSKKENVIPALSAAMERLYDRGRGMVKLLDPPYSCAERPVGYISGYGEGFRENGGQYTHAAVWLAMAALHSGYADEGWEMLRCLLPENHSPEVYRAEPFVLPADVYSARGREGLAGWTWYTGSAGWFFRTVLCELFGLQLSKGRLYIRPRLPGSMSGFELDWSSPGGKLFSIRCSGAEISVNGRPYKGEGLEI